MGHRFFVIIAFFATVVFSQRVGWFSFTQRDDDELVECVYDVLREYVNTHFKEIYLEDVIDDVADQVARLHYAGEVDAEYIGQVIKLSINFLRSRRDYIRRVEIPWEMIKECTEFTIKSFCSDSLLPKFNYEPQDVASTLDYILVNWNDSIYNMAQTHEGRSILRIYASTAQIMLREALSYYDSDNFRALIRTLWMRRAQRYFNISNHRYPYVPHIFDQNRILPISDPDYFDDDLMSRPSTSTNRYGNWEERNPRASQEYLDRILNIHTLDRSSFYYECDIFNVYERNGISSAEYYFETQNDQFYRIIFFFQELEARNITNDLEDIYPEQLPSDLIPQIVYEMLRNGTQYRDYLLQLRQIHEDLNGNLLRRNLASRSRVCEEDFIQLMISEGSNWKITASVTNKININESTTTTTTKSPTVSTTSTFNSVTQSKSGKGSVYKNHFKKNFSKKPKTKYSSDCSFRKKTHIIKNDGSRYLMTFSICYLISRKEQRHEKKIHNFGFVTFNSNLYQPDETSFLLDYLLAYNNLATIPL